MDERASMFLSSEEIAELTDYVRRGEQRKQLDRMGIPFGVGRNGQPLVLRVVILEKFGATMKRPEAQSSINIDALRGAMYGT